MKFKLGEFVRFVDENREGFITKIIDDTLVGVTGEDDFEIPVAVTNLTRVHGHKSNTVQEHEHAASGEVQEGVFKKEGIFLAVVPDKNKHVIVHFYILNETSFDLLFALHSEKNVFKGEFAAIVKKESFEKIYPAALPDLDLWPRLNLRALTYTVGNVSPLKPIDVWMKFKSKDFSGSKANIHLVNEQGWLFQLDEVELKIDVEKLKESFFKPQDEKKDIDKPSKEVDLHIEKLREDHAFLNKNEILDFQLAAFERSLDAAIAHKFSDITFIHGLGNGVLKNHIHKTAGKHPQVKTFKDALKEKFGYGATQIFLK